MSGFLRRQAFNPNSLRRHFRLVTWTLEYSRKPSLISCAVEWGSVQTDFWQGRPDLVLVHTFSLSSWRRFHTLTSWRDTPNCLATWDWGEPWDRLLMTTCRKSMSYFVRFIFAILIDWANSRGALRCCWESDFGIVVYPVSKDFCSTSKRLFFWKVFRGDWRRPSQR